MLEAVLDELRNWFPKEFDAGVYTVLDGVLQGCDGWIAEGQYFRVLGSTFNDGLHRWPCSDLVDETFEGEVWKLAIPPAVISLAEDISEWDSKYGAGEVGPYQSESFGGYSYSLATSGSGKGGPVTWRDVFSSRLDRWRKLYESYR